MQPQVKIISDDMCGRNGLKSKVSTLEELYDFFSENTQKLHQYDVIFGAVDILSTGSIFFPLPMATALYPVLSEYGTHKPAA